MSEQIDTEETRREMTRGQMHGGGSSRGPEVDPGGVVEPQGLVPPYERAESEQAHETGVEGVSRAFRAEEFGGEPGPTPPVSKVEREGVPPTDTTAATPLGVGVGNRASGEEAGGKEAGREDTGPHGRTERAGGVSTGSDITGVNPSSGQTHQSEALTHEDPDDTSR
jgi:hypothetical protein